MERDCAAVIPKELKRKWSFGIAGARGFGMLGGHVRRIKSSFSSGDNLRPSNEHIIEMHCSLPNMVATSAVPRSKSAN